MREGRRFALGFFFLLTIALLSLSNVPLVFADEAVEESSGGGAEAVVDATGDVQVDEPEPPQEDEDDGAAAAAAAEAAAAAANAKAEAEAKAAAEAEGARIAKEAEEMAAAAAAAAAEVVEEEEKTQSTAFVGDVAASAKSKAMSFVDKAKEITPAQMKKVAAGALGVWGVAAGAGWVMNNLGGAEE